MGGLGGGRGDSRLQVPSVQDPQPPSCKTEMLEEQSKDRTTLDKTRRGVTSGWDLTSPRPRPAQEPQTLLRVLGHQVQNGCSSASMVRRTKSQEEEHFMTRDGT